MKEIKNSRLFITNSGKLLDFKNICIDDICLEDIAHHLTKICRYGVALPFNVHYSVAQHSILLSKYASLELNNQELAKLAILHDATEAYMGDIVSGVKQMLPDYKKLEDNLEQLIFNKYNIKFTKELKDKMKYIDSTFVLDEAYWLFNKAYNILEKNCLEEIY